MTAELLLLWPRQLLRQFHAGGHRSLLRRTFADPGDMAVNSGRSGIIFTETAACGETRLSVSLITVALEAEGPHTRLTLTDQIAAIDNAGMVSGNEAGLGAALDNLAHELRRDRATARAEIF